MKKNINDTGGFVHEWSVETSGSKYSALMLLLTMILKGNTYQKIPLTTCLTCFTEDGDEHAMADDIIL